MKTTKKQIILGALILALGAAVYLNWQFSSSIPVEQPVSALPQEETDIEDEDIGIAQLVNNSYIETVNDEAVTPNTTNVEADTTAIDNVAQVMSNARVTRQSTRDAALEILSDVLDNVESSDEAKKVAVEESAQIAQDMIEESNIENLLKAKGMDDVVVFISEDNCNVVVKGLEGNTLIVQEIVTNETGLGVDKIQIIDAN